MLWWLALFTSFVISVINYLAKFVIIGTVKAWGFKTFTDETKVTKWIISLLTFISKCLLIVLLTANFEYGTVVFNGEYSDYNS